MITEISPILGLNLLELIEHTVILVFGVSIGTLIGVWYWNFKQHKLQVKSTSAQLALKLVEKWHNDLLFSEITFDLGTEDIQFTDKDKVNPVLAVFEDIAILKRDKLLTETHVREFFGREIVRINANVSIMKIIDDFHKRDVKHNYNNLKEMLEDSKKWGMDPY